MTQSEIVTIAGVIGSVDGKNVVYSAYAIVYGQSQCRYLATGGTVYRVICSKKIAQRVVPKGAKVEFRRNLTIYHGIKTDPKDLFDNEPWHVVPTNYVDCRDNIHSGFCA